MSRIMISESKDYLIKDGKPFFYLGDTIWMAFSKLRIKEWEEYLYYRKTQGFNVLQISLLPLCHDNSYSEEDLFPFVKREDGTYDFNKYDEEYFNNVEVLLEKAHEYGITVCLHLLWVNYIPNTWASSEKTSLPFESLEPLYTYIINRYKKYEPIYAASGDIRFECQEVIDYCLKVMEIVKLNDPEGLCTLHLAPNEDLPQIILSSPYYDFYTFQSGHDYLKISNTYNFAKQFLSKENYKKPIINTEPGYEGHRHGYRKGRFDESDVRKETYLSILGGAKAGIGYGAHGVWMCHKRKMQFNNIQFSGIPFDFGTALRFKGAWEVAFCKKLYEMYDMHRLQPCQITQENLEDVLSAKSDDDSLVVIYSPYNAQIEVEMDLRGYKAEMIILDERYFAFPELVLTDKTVIKSNDFNGDILYVFTKN